MQLHTSYRRLEQVRTWMQDYFGFAVFDWALDGHAETFQLLLHYNSATIVINTMMFNIVVMNINSHVYKRHIDR